MTDKYIKLSDLVVYKLAIELSELAWNIYDNFDWQDRKIMGDQFIRSADSFGANIAEGYGRFHYLDRIKFYYNSRASLAEAKHWCFLLYSRQKINKEVFEKFQSKCEKANFELNKFIKITYQSKDNEVKR